ncbi:hypothetical protein NP493_364g02072 [Ridgeia piscesae]|uniref:Uncharacterized protein n=1 Tax=Ridgeia piscesae TaxID=27915 RepID=A0AAD9L3Y4_RIDPI|nr:hypothetical protein NP493_364g02072 [Ridgeia piscesae]
MDTELVCCITLVIRRAAVEAISTAYSLGHGATAVVALCCPNLTAGVILGTFCRPSWARCLRRGCTSSLGQGRGWGLRVPLDIEGALVATRRDRVTCVAIRAAVQVVRAAHRLWQWAAAIFASTQHTTCVAIWACSLLVRTDHRVGSLRLEVEGVIAARNDTHKEADTQQLEQHDLQERTSLESRRELEQHGVQKGQV